VNVTREVQTIGEKDTSRAERGKLRWWLETDPDEAHAALFRWADAVRARPANVERRKQMLVYASVYANLPLLGFGLNNYTRSVSRGHASPSRMALNATQNAIDALVAKVTKNRPKPTFTTIEGEWEMRERAERKGRFVTGQFYASDFYAVAAGNILHAAVFGTSHLKVYEDRDKEDVAIDRVAPWELDVDDREAMYGKPRSIGQRKFYDRQVVLEMFAAEPKDETAEAREKRLVLIEAIEAAGIDADDDDIDYDENSDQIRVYEAWHLPSSTKAKDGKHIIAIRGATLLLEDFTDDDFPIVSIRPTTALFGFWGTGICEKVCGIQAEINRIVRDIQAAMHLVAKPHWMVEGNSKVNTSALDNDIATIIRYMGAVPPQVYVPQAMSAEVYQHLQFLYRTLYEITGVSQMSAQSQLPEGLHGASGTAMRTYLNNESERFGEFIRAYEEFTKSVAEKMVAVARQIAKRHKNYAVRAIGKAGYEDMRWADVELGDKYTIQVFPTSMLPSTPAGKLAWVGEMTQTLGVDPDTALELIDWPDTDEYMKRRLAPRRLIERDIAAMKRGVSVMPEPYAPHALAFKLVAEAYADARYDGLPEERLELFREYMENTQDLMNPPAQPPPGMPANNNGAPAMPMAANGGAPPAPPMPMSPPISAPPGAPIQ
jgi:hypothetical protein